MVDPSRGKEAHQGYIARTYRDFRPRDNLIAFSISWKETDLYIKAERDISEQALAGVIKYRKDIEIYIQHHPDFRTSLTPLPLDTTASPIVREMLEAAASAGVGPMASVAGAMSEYVGRDLKRFSREIIIENGGDLFLDTSTAVTVSIFAGRSPLSMQIGLRIPSEQIPCGACTSSGTVGPSLSYGRADAVTVWASSTALADAAATALANRIARPEDIEPVLQGASEIPGLKGAVAILGDKIGLWGDVDIVRTKQSA